SKLEDWLFLFYSPFPSSSKTGSYFYTATKTYAQLINQNLVNAYTEYKQLPILLENEAEILKAKIKSLKKN
ncbi:MAG: hypothetical protein JW987_10665, partial [Anaerolineaceae bacterium]|nr:hypothetical protein [Anaerolineaceae bacterium]